MSQIIIKDIELHTLRSISYALKYKLRNYIWGEELEKIILKIEEMNKIIRGKK